MPEQSWVGKEYYRLEEEIFLKRSKVFCIGRSFLWLCLGFPLLTSVSILTGCPSELPLPVLCIDQTLGLDIRRECDDLLLFLRHTTTRDLSISSSQNTRDSELRHFTVDVAIWRDLSRNLLPGMSRIRKVKGPRVVVKNRAGWRLRSKHFMIKLQFPISDSVWKTPQSRSAYLDPQISC